MAKATILLFDNDTDFLETSSSFLQSKGYQVIATQNLQEAKKNLELEKIDLAIIDLRLETDDEQTDRSGLVIARELPASFPKIILTSSLGVSMMGFRKKPTTATRFIDKAVRPSVLLAEVEDLLRTVLSGDSTTDAPPPEVKKKKKDKKN